MPMPRWKVVVGIAVVVVIAAGRARAEGDPFAGIIKLVAPSPASGASPDVVGAAAVPRSSSPPVMLADNVLTGPTSREAATRPVDQPSNGAQRTLAEFVGHFAPYEPIYFVAGPYDPLVRFQFSFKYRLFNPDSPIGKVPVIGQLNFAYTQLSLWQLDRPSSPFLDTNYQPEAFYNDDDVKWVKLPAVSQFGLMAGFGHDSNGRDGTASRQVNILFVKPTFNFGDPEGFHAYISPKAYFYLGNNDENPDIAVYRGYVDARFVVGWRYGPEFSAVGRIGSHADRGSVVLDLTYPLRDLLFKNVDLYADVQYFDGYGETLLNYNQRSQELRFGFALVR